MNSRHEVIMSARLRTIFEGDADEEAIRAAEEFAARYLHRHFVFRIPGEKYAVDVWIEPQIDEKPEIEHAHVWEPNNSSFEEVAPDQFPGLSDRERIDVLPARTLTAEAQELLIRSRVHEAMDNSEEQWFPGIRYDYRTNTYQNQWGVEVLDKQSGKLVRFFPADERRAFLNL